MLSPGRGEFVLRGILGAPNVLGGGLFLTERFYSPNEPQRVIVNSWIITPLSRPPPFLSSNIESTLPLSPKNQKDTSCAHHG